MGGRTSLLLKSSHTLTIQRNFAGTSSGPTPEKGIRFFPPDKEEYPHAFNQDNYLPFPQSTKAQIATAMAVYNQKFDKKTILTILKKIRHQVPSPIALVYWARAIFEQKLGTDKEILLQLAKVLPDLKVDCSSLSQINMADIGLNSTAELIYLIQHTLALAIVTKKLGEDEEILSYVNKAVIQFKREFKCPKALLVLNKYCL